jgi:Tat protein secretion system quality control protein TatD with DNase activity
MSPTPAHDSYFFYGIHPWDIQKEFIEENFKLATIQKHFLGIGEIGLDKLKPNYQLQLELFEKQINFAVKNKVSLITIHNIKANDDIIRVLKKYHYQGKLLIHDFNQSIDNYNQFNRLWDTYISTGIRYINNEKIRHTFNQAPISKVLLETDDQQDLDIMGIYEQFSEEYGINIEQLSAQMTQNFTDLINFNKR